MAAVPERTLAVERWQHLWRPAGTYLNTASYGLPPDPVWKAVQAALEDWRAGRTSWEHWNEATQRARARFAELVGVGPERVAVGSTISQLIGLVAAAVPDGARVVVPEIDFTSLLFPWLVHRDRGFDVRTVPLDELPAAVDEGTTVVAFSLVQSATGEIAPVDDLVDAAARVGALTVVDATQACGWLPVDASRFDALAGAGYKWLMSPRGTAFLVVGERLHRLLRPLAAGWYAGEDPHASYYGPPLRLARDARRFDTSPAWFSWIGTDAALEVVGEIGVEAINAHDVRLANRFRERVGLPPSDSAIVPVRAPGAPARLEAAGVRAAVRANAARVSFHVYNTEADVDAAADALMRSASNSRDADRRQVGR